MAFVLFTNEITPFYKFVKIQCCQQYGKLKSSVSLTGFKSTLIVRLQLTQFTIIKPQFEDSAKGD